MQKSERDVGVIGGGGDTRVRRTSTKSTTRGTTVPQLPPVQLGRLSTAGRNTTNTSAPGPCTPCTDPTQSTLLNLKKECFQEKLSMRNQTLYRLASPHELAKIPEHLRSLKTIPLGEPSEDESEEECPRPAPIPYYPAEHGPKKKRRGSAQGRKPAERNYWRWEKPPKHKLEPRLPDACRILEDIEKPSPKSVDGSQTSLVTLFPPPLASGGDPEESESEVEGWEDEDEEEDEDEFEYEIIDEPPPAPPPKPRRISKLPAEIPIKSTITRVNELGEEVEDGDYYVERGPKLRIKTENNETLLLLKTDEEKEGSDATPLFIDDIDDFETNSRCAETKKIVMMNEGTVAIRFQWFRAPPGRCYQKLLENPAKIFQFSKNPSHRLDNHEEHGCGYSSRPRERVHDWSTPPQKVNPTLDPTIKTLKKSIKSGPGFKNMLLLLSLRARKLKREWICAGLGQLRPETLSDQIDLLYDKLRQQRGAKYYSRKHSQRKRLRIQKRLDSSQCWTSMDGNEEEGEDLPKVMLPECPCVSTLSDSDFSDLCQPDNYDDFFFFTEPPPLECTCERPIYPQPHSSFVTLHEWGSEDRQLPTIPEELEPEDAPAPTCHYVPRPQLQVPCVCEGICICKPPAPEDGLCVCGPCCICSPDPSWETIRRWTKENEGEGRSCRCLGICTCVAEEEEGEDLDRPRYPSAPPPSVLGESCGSYQGEDACCLGKDACCLGEDAPCLGEDACCQWQGPCWQGEGATCQWQDPGWEGEDSRYQWHPLDPLFSDEHICACGSPCPCITPPVSPFCSETRLDLGHTTEPLPEDYSCTCVPFCNCVSQDSTFDCVQTDDLGPEDICICPVCKCGVLPLGYDGSQNPQALMGAGDGPPGEDYPHFNPSEIAREDGEYEGEGPALTEFYGEGGFLEPRGRLEYYKKMCNRGISRQMPMPGEDGWEDEWGCYDRVPVYDELAVPIPFHELLPEVDRSNNLELLMEPRPEFIFCELPRTILPGQTVKFEVMFRPRELGMFSETIYLLTYPRLDAVAYAVRLHGICMDPPVPQVTSCEGEEEKHEPCAVTGGVTKPLYAQMYQRQGTQALNAIVDHVLHDTKQPKTTVPFGRVTSEAIFKAHNQDLYYYPEVSERALQLVRTLVQLLVARTTIMQNQRSICQRNIAALYYQLLKHPSQQDYFMDNLNSDQVEELLKDLSKCTAQLIQPPIFMGVSAAERCRTGTDATVIAMTDEIVRTFRNIGETTRNPFRTYIWRKELKEKLDYVRESEIVEVVEQHRHERESRRLMRKLSVSTQVNSKEDLVVLEPEPTVAPSDDITDEQDAEGLRETTPEVRNTDVEYHVQLIIEESTHESCLHAAENILTASIERMLSFMDATDNICDYDPQQVIFSTAEDNVDFCC